MKTKLFLTICGLFLILSCPLYSQHLDKAVYSVEGLFNTFEFLEVIKEQTGYRIAYKQSDLRDEKKVKLYYKNKPLDVVLKDALAIRAVVRDIWKPDYHQKRNSLVQGGDKWHGKE